jgi:hypothetical protein
MHEMKKLQTSPTLVPPHLSNTAKLSTTPTWTILIGVTHQGPTDQGGPEGAPTWHIGLEVYFDLLSLK